MKTIPLTINVPLSDVMAAAQSDVDLLIKERVLKALTREDTRVRTLFAATELAIMNTTRAMVRVENSRHSKDELPAVAALVAAAKGLRDAHAAYKSLKGKSQ